jgi:hypothetical protein
MGVTADWLAPCRIQEHSEPAAGGRPLSLPEAGFGNAPYPEIRAEESPAYRLVEIHIYGIDELE